MGHDAAGQEVPQTRALTMVESIQMALVWRASRKKFGLEDVDIYSPSFRVATAAAASPSGTAPAPQAVGSKVPLGTKKIKVAQVMDQMDDTELELLPQKDLDRAFEVYRERMGHGI